jgi:hypothetical protein
MFVNYIAWAKIVLLHASVPSEIFREKLEIIGRQCREGLTDPFAEQIGGILELTLRKYPDMPERRRRSSTAMPRRARSPGGIWNTFSEGSVSRPRRR